MRLSEDLRKRILAAANASGRSMTAEMTYTLESHYPGPPSQEESDALAAAFDDHSDMDSDEWRRRLIKIFPRQSQRVQDALLTQLVRLVVKGLADGDLVVKPKGKREKS